MLQIKGICKTYHTGSLTQRALDHVSLNLRDSEFVAILGPSGSGKTTLLNIIGGLDRYDEGDLIINGVSTKKYSDRDWDSYRNHTIGFVFQSYNLIPHQTVLANVELALTICGISRAERTRRATAALQQVGLGDHIHKKPAQLSGGQMQRVAIARALVNDPDILLADEPTGALDSDTSLQIMDLLQEVARDRLVVMVTHNPELAEQYATRIVRLRDGVIRSDSDPFDPDVAEPAVHRNLGKASMSFLTSLFLSFNNLKTKLARTILVAFAGSIGIIGIALILSLSTGVDRYIQNMEEETLQGYPLQITDTSFDMTAFMPAEDTETTEGSADSPEPDGDEAPADEGVQAAQEWKTITRMFSRVSTNDLKSLKAYLDSADSGIDPYVRSIEYDYNLSPQIFSLEHDTVRQVNPEKSFAAMGFSATENMNGILSSMYNTNTFHPMPEDESLYETQYDLRAGRWPERYNECVVVLSSSGRITDMTLYTLGLKDPATLDEMVQIFVEGGDPVEDSPEEIYSYADILRCTFRLVNSADYYVYDREYDVWTDKSGDAKFLKDLVEQGELLTVVGIVQPKEDATSSLLPIGIGYPADLISHIMEKAADSAVVRAQLQDETQNILTGTAFGAEAEPRDMDMSSLFSVDQQAIEDAFQTDQTDLDLDESLWENWDWSGMDYSGLDLTTAIDPSDYSSISMPAVSSQDIASLLSGVKINISAANVDAMFRSLLEGFQNYSRDDPALDYSQLSDAVKEYLSSEAARTILETDVQSILATISENAITVEDLQAMLTDVMAGYPAYVAEVDPEAADPYTNLPAYLQTPAVQLQIQSHAEALQARIAAMTVTPEQLGAISQDLMAGYQAYAEANALPDPFKLQEAFTGYMATPEAQTILSTSVRQAVDTSALESRAAAMLTSYSNAIGVQISAMMEQLIAAMTKSVTDSISDNLDAFMAELTENFTSAFQLDPDTLAEAFSMNFSPEDLRALMDSLMSTEQASYESNLKKLGYADPDVPTSITIYPTDFAGKAQVKKILDDYNTRQKETDHEERMIAYTDVVDTLMRSVTDIIDAISYVLVAFVSISLVVSSIMIGVITYISVLERSKEIGILRAIGASKRNISEVFNAETFIIGTLAGLIGIGITRLLLIPANLIIHSLTDADIQAVLPLPAAGALVALSILLTLIGGIIPSRKAAKSDPVAALRSE